MEATRGLSGYGSLTDEQLESMAPGATIGQMKKTAARLAKEYESSGMALIRSQAQALGAYARKEEDS